MGLTIEDVPSGGNSRENIWKKSCQSLAAVHLLLFYLFLSRRASPTVRWILCRCWNTPLTFTTTSIIHSAFGVPGVCPGMLHKWTFCWSLNCRKSWNLSALWMWLTLNYVCHICGFPTNVDAEHPITCIQPPWRSLKLPFNKREILTITAWVCTKPDKLNHWQLLLFLSSLLNWMPLWISQTDWKQQLSTDTLLNVFEWWGERHDSILPSKHHEGQLWLYHIKWK